MRTGSWFVAEQVELFEAPQDAFKRLLRLTFVFKTTISYDYRL